MPETSRCIPFPFNPSTTNDNKHKFMYTGRVDFNNAEPLLFEKQKNKKKLH